jgi:hypothetical protein
VFDTTSNSTKYNQWLHEISTNGKVRKDFDRIQNFSLRQKEENPTFTVGFVWEIQTKYRRGGSLVQFTDIESTKQCHLKEI